MKKSTLLLTVFVLSAFTAKLYAQKITLEKGDLSFLKDQSEINIQYDFTSLGVGNFSDEEDYIQKKTKEYNEKESGRGDTWAASWQNDKITRYPAKFEELINDGSKIKYGQNSENAKYTLIVKTTFIEPGYNIGITKKPSFINVEYIFVETTNPTNVVAKLSQKNVPGTSFYGADFDTGARISESYAKAGKMLKNYIEKALK